MAFAFKPFQEEHLGAAARLLAARQQRDRQNLPQLPARFEDPQTTRAALRFVWQRPWASGTVALAAGEVVAYLLGTPTFDQHGGRTVWIRPAGYALSNDLDTEIVGELYALAGQRWLELGCFDHYAMISTADQTQLEMWYSLNFGRQQAHGILTLGNVASQGAQKNSSLQVRRAGASDASHLAELSYITAEHNFRAPVWAPTPLEVVSSRPQSYREIARDGEATAWLAFSRTAQEEEALGFQVYYEAAPEADELYIPESCTELAAAGTKAEARGRGVGLALTRAALNHAGEAGYTYCLTDWRTANLQASRFWTRRGFEPVIYRLHRHVDPRILWANKTNN